MIMVHNVSPGSFEIVVNSALTGHRILVDMEGERVADLVEQWATTSRNCAHAFRFFLSLEDHPTLYVFDPACRETLLREHSKDELEGALRRVAIT